METYLDIYKQSYCTVPNVETCAGFQQLARNVNPQLLSNCDQNGACTQITCQAMGQLSTEIDAVSIMLDVCKNNTAPGVIVELLRDGIQPVDYYLNQDKLFKSWHSNDRGYHNYSGTAQTVPLEYL